MRTETVKCDACQTDLTVRTNSVDYRLVLGSEAKPGYGSGVYTDMMKYPSVDRDYHFCGLSCLDKWRDRERHKNKLRSEWHEAWKQEHGTKHTDGMWSYPSAGSDGREVREAEYEAAALAAYP